MDKIQGSLHDIVVDFVALCQPTQANDVWVSCMRAILTCAATLPRTRSCSTKRRAPVSLLEAAASRKGSGERMRRPLPLADVK
jgi:hypothetical protein